MAVFFQSFMIVLREGIEAILIVAALAAYLRRVGAGHRVMSLYTGAALAIVLSLVAGWMLDRYVDAFDNTTVDMVLLFGAAGLMLYVSGWLFIGPGAGAWQNYLRSRTDVALSRRTEFAMAALAFLAVFREGAETVIFLTVLSQVNDNHDLIILGGSVAALTALATLFYAVANVGRSLPMRLLFVATSGFLFVSAVHLLGEAVTQLQKVNYIPTTALRGASWLKALGLNLSWEALSLQLAVILASAVSLCLLARRTRQPTGQN